MDGESPTDFGISDHGLAAVITLLLPYVYTFLVQVPLLPCMYQVFHTWYVHRYLERPKSSVYILRGIPIPPVFREFFDCVNSVIA
jgi:hypothetical protein